MDVFVTGGSGFVGGRLVEALVTRGDRVRALARSDRSAGKVEALGAEAVRGDLSSVDAMAAGMDGCELAFHAAAKVDHWGRREDFRAVNVEGTANVVDAARHAGVNRLVHVGTEAALVDGSPMVNVDETRPLPEHPIGLYPWSKGAAERIVREANGPDLTTVVTRPRFVWGLGDTTLLPQISDAVRDGKFAWVDGGHYQTSTCHVANVVEGLLLAAEHGRGGEAYFLTDGEPVEFREFLTDMLRTQGVEPGDREIPWWLVYRLASGAEFLWSALRLSSEPPLTRTMLLLSSREMTVDDTKARRELGYVGKVSIEDGLRELAEASD